MFYFKKITKNQARRIVQVKKRLRLGHLSAITFSKMFK